MPRAPGNRSAILDHAARVASVDGLDGLTIGRLASELEMSKSGVFGHFGSKEELQRATFEHACRVFVRDVVAPAGAIPEGMPRLRALVDRYLEFVERCELPGGCILQTAAAEFDARPGALRDTVRAALDAWVGELERHARIAGVDDPAQLAFELHAIGQAANQAIQLGREDAVERARRAIERLLG